MFITDLSNNRKIKIKPIDYLISVAADCISNQSILENSKLKPKSTLGKDTKQNFWWTSRFRCCNVCATKHAHNGHCFDFVLCAFCVSVGTSGSQLTITMMKLKVMKEKKISELTCILWKVTALGMMTGSTPVGLSGKQQASESRPSSSRLIMRVGVIVRKPHGIDGETESLILCLNTVWECKRVCWAH